MAHDHSPKTVERHCDVAIVGGSFAGLAAGVQLGRQRRSVIVVDAGEPRNAPATHMHGFLGRDGTSPAELSAAGREEVRSYGGEVLDGRVSSVQRLEDGRFRLELVGGHGIVARRVVAAIGLVDVLPDIDGLAEHWGGDVIHCPFCHGYEVRDRRIVQIVTHPRGVHPSVLFRQLTDHLTVVVHGEVAGIEPDLERLRSSGVEVVVEAVTRIVDGDDGRLAGVELRSGRVIPADAVAVGPTFRVHTEPFEAAGLKTTPHPSGLGDHIATDPSGQTDVPGLYAAGNSTDPSQQVLAAAANGAWVGSMVSFSLAEEDAATAARPSANQADWDHRYRDEPMWSGNPNGTLVKEVTGLTPGRALDVGAGEGADSIWLAEHGWQVVANDIAARALERLAAEAGRRQVAVTCLTADANAVEPFGTERFELVSAQYASIPRSADGRGVRNLLDAVAPGGRLLVVSHDLTPMRGPIDTTTNSRAHDPDAYLRVDDVVAAIAHTPDWEIEVHEARPRPSGAASSHHVDDVVLRARRIR